MTAKLWWPMLVVVDPSAVRRGGCSYLGRPRLRLKGRRSHERSEESAEAVVAASKPVNEPEVFDDCEGLNERTG